VTKLVERDVNPEDIPEGRIVPGDARHSEFIMGSWLCKCGHLGSRHGMDPPIERPGRKINGRRIFAVEVCYSYNCADCKCERFDPLRGR